MSENIEAEKNSSATVDIPIEKDKTPCETSEILPNVPASAANQMDRVEVLSKRQQKKLLKIAKWEETKKLKRQQEREKRKQRRIKEVELGLPGPCSKRKKLKLNKIENSPNPVTVAIDFDYDELMQDKDIAKCAKQMLRVYTENRKSSMPIKLHFTSIKENGRIEKSLERNDGYKNWDVKIHQESYNEIFDHDSIVYLSSDSENVLHELDPKAVYIIGGLVDHNHQKGLSLQRAEQKGLKTARLPLSEHISMKTRSVLTIVHVFEIILRISEGKPWKETLMEVLPMRKFRMGNKPKHKLNGAGKMSSDSECLYENDDEKEQTTDGTNTNAIDQTINEKIESNTAEHSIENSVS